jgi:hypothetical protein
MWCERARAEAPGSCSAVVAETLPVDVRLARAAARARRVLDPSSVRAISSFVFSQMEPNGSFRGRDGGGDLYYTLFALLCLDALGEAAPPTSRDFVARHSYATLDLVHLSCLVRCRRLLGLGGEEELLAGCVAEYRAPDGAFRRHHGSGVGSIYASFLALMALELCGRPLSDPPSLLEALWRRRCPDGGFADRPGMVEGTTTVTAAAVALLSSLRSSIPSSVSEWLSARRHAEGGFAAGPRALMPDLLATATALFALAEMKRPLACLAVPCFAFVDSLWHGSGGFVGHPLDTVPDCEYSFYALLGLGLLAEAL